MKTRDDKRQKVFINLCQLDEIPEPKSITEDEVLELWQSEEVSDYRVPLSIQDPHDELDKCKCWLLVIKHLHIPCTLYYIYSN